jgi:hypothetical protein
MCVFEKGLMKAKLGFLVSLTAAALVPWKGAAASELAAPFRVEADGKPIDTETGHAVPLMIDFDGDGVRDLLVGQFSGGKLRIYRNVGSNTQPKFGAFAWFNAGGKEASVPFG